MQENPNLYRGFSANFLSGLQKKPLGSPGETTWTSNRLVVMFVSAVVKWI